MKASAPAAPEPAAAADPSVPPEATYSLRRRLLGVLISASAAVWLAVALTSYLDTRRELEALLDLRLMEAARIQLSQGGRLAGTLPTGMLAFSADDAAEPPPPTGRFGERRLGNARWRTLAISDPVTGARVEVGESYALREELAGYAALRIALPMLLGLPALALVIWLGVGKGLAPVERVAREIQARPPLLFTPLPVDRMPTELRPLVDALNSLFRRLEQAFEGEHRFTADAAHELRTPLAAIRTHLQLALRSGGQVHDEALANVLKGAVRAGHVVEQLLTLARLDPQGEQPVADLVDLEWLVDEQVEEFQPEAQRSGTSLAAEHAGTGALLEGSVAPLRLLLRNLLDNALRYTPPGGRVAVRASTDAEGVQLEVDDSGPGIGEEERQRVFDRFYRGAHPDIPGSGLGLSIVQQVARLHRAKVTLADSPLGGLRVRVSFPALEAEA